MANPDRTRMQKHVKKQQLFLLSQLQHIINIDTRKLFCNAHIKPHIDYASAVWDGCGEGRQIKMSALEILSLPQQLAYNKGILMHKVLNNNVPDYLSQLFISHRSLYTNSKNNLYVPRPRLDLSKTNISFAGASLWNSLPQNKNSYISLPCFKCNLHKYMSENNLSSSLDVFVWITRLPKKKKKKKEREREKKKSVVYMYAHERNVILMFLHICRNYETALINSVIVLIILVCGIVVFIYVSSI